MRSWRHLFIVCCLSLLVVEPALAASRPQPPAKPGTLIEYVLLCGLIAIPAGQAAISSRARRVRSANPRELAA